ncbi:MAG: acyltransferase [Chthoniobacter sp.]|nr:acyltransferase [Chthoniobacter sp.]
MNPSLTAEAPHQPASVSQSATTSPTRTKSFFDRWFFGSAKQRELQMDSLDGLRGMAVLWVMIDHARSHGWTLHPAFHFGSGDVGVFLFFCLSAFLLTLPICESPASELDRPRHWANYAVRRFFRIYPLFLAILFVFFVLQPLAGHKHLREFLPVIWQHLTLRGDYRHLWTIAVETKFYFMLPFIGVSLHLLRGRPWLQTGITAVAIGLATFFYPPAASPNDTLITGFYLPVFLCGCLGAELLSTWRKQRPAFLTPLRCEIVALVTLLIALPLADNILMARCQPNFDGSRSFILWGLVWATFIVTHLFGTGFCRSLFAWKPFRFVGIVSYSAYIWHPVILSSMKPLKKFLPLPLGTAAFFLVTLGLASVSYLAIERPLARIRLPK